MQRKFIRNLALLIFLNLLVKPFWILGIDREVQNIVGPGEYGFYFAVLNFSFLFYILLDLGITNFNNRNIAQNNQLLNKHLAGIGTLKIMLGFLYAIVIFLIGWLIGYDQRQLYILAWVGFNQFLLSFILYLRSNLGGLLLFKTDSLISVLDRVLMILFCSILIWTNIFGGQFHIEWFVYAQTLSYLLTAIIAFIAVLNRSGKLKMSWNVPFFLMILKKSLPFALLVLLMSFYNRIDPVLIERLLPGDLGKSQSGVYAQAFRLLDAGQNFSYLFAVLLLPIFSKMLKDKQPVGQLVQMSFSLIITGALVILVVSVFFGNEIMMLMYRQGEGESLTAYLERIDQSALIFRLLMFSFLAISTTYIFGTLLTANNSLKQLNGVALVGLLLNLVLNFLLIPKFLAVGAAIANVSAQGITALIQVVLAYRMINMRFDRGFYIRLFIYIFLLFMMGLGLVRLFDLDWKLAIGLLIMAALIIASALRLLHVRAFISMLKSQPKN